MKQGKHALNKIKICVSGASATGHCGMTAFRVAEELGREIARHRAVLVNGATIGFPLWAAMGAKEEGGFCLGFSPAASEKEHTEIYRLPTDYLDVVVYTGFGYSGRNLLLTRSADAVIVGCGRIGTINEFTIAYEDGKPIGILESEWKTDEVIRHIMNESHHSNKNVIFDTEPKRLLERVIELAQLQRRKRGVRGSIFGDSALE